MRRRRDRRARPETRSINFDELIDEKHSLFTENQKLIWAAMQLYRGCWINLTEEEARDVCEMALLRACKKFQEERQRKLSTVAFFYAKNALISENRKAMLRKQIRLTLNIHCDGETPTVELADEHEESDHEEAYRVVRRIIKRRLKKKESWKSIAKSLRISEEYARLLVIDPA